MSHARRLERQSHAWIEKVRQGDEAAFEALFRAFAPGLCAFATRYVESRQTAEDVVQDLFLDLWRRRTTLVIEQAVGTYLFTAVRNRALNHLRRERAVERWAAGAARRTDNAPALAENDLLDLLELQDAISRLPARCRLIFSLSREQDLSYREIAESLGISIKTVETQMGRALKALRAWYSSG